MSVISGCKFGSIKLKRLSVVLVQREVGAFWFPQTLSLFHFHVSKTAGSPEGYVAVPYFDLISPDDEVNKKFKYFCLRRASEYNIEKSVQYHSTMSNTGKKEEWYDLVAFLSVRLVYEIVRSNHAVKSFPDQTLWPCPSIFRDSINTDGEDV